MLTRCRWSLALTEAPFCPTRPSHYGLALQPTVLAGKCVSRSLRAARTAAEDRAEGAPAVVPVRPHGGLRKPPRPPPPHSGSRRLLVGLLAAVAQSCLFLLQRRLPGVLAAPVGRTHSSSVTRAAGSARGHCAAGSRPGLCNRHSATALPPAEINATSARVLLALVVPGHLAFFSIVSLLESQSVPSERTFVLLYLLAGLVQVRGAVPHPGRGPWTSGT